MLKKTFAVILGAVLICAAAAVGWGSAPVPVSAETEAQSVLQQLPETLLEETFNFDDSDIGNEIAGWNGWTASASTAEELPDSRFTLGEDADGNRVAVLERTAPASVTSVHYHVRKQLNIGYGTEKIGVGFRIKSMDDDNGVFLLQLGDGAPIQICVDLSKSCITTPNFSTPFIPIEDRASKTPAKLGQWYDIEIVIDTGIQQIDFYTQGVYRGSSDMTQPSSDFAGDIRHGVMRSVSIGTTRTGGVVSGGDSAKMYVDDLTVKTTKTPAGKITHAEIADGMLSGITLRTNENAGENAKVIAASYQYRGSGAEISDIRITGFSDGDKVFESPLAIPENGEIQIFAFEMEEMKPLIMVYSICSNQTYYVSPNGNDANGGTRLRPWKTLYKAAKTAAAGDTVIFEDGEYFETYAAHMKNGGTEDRPIVMRAAENKKAKIKYSASLSTKPKLMIPPGRNYLTVDGFEFTQERPAVSETDTNDIFLWCEGDYCNIINNSFSGAMEEGIKLNRCKGTVIAGNYIEEMKHEGIDIFNVDMVQVHDNEIHNVCRIGILAKGNTRNSQIYNNYVHNSEASMSNCAFAIGGISDSSSPSDIKENTGYECYSTAFYNNVALAHGNGTVDTGFKWYGAIDCKLFNNIAIGMNKGIHFAAFTSHWEWSPRNVNPMARNNIIYHCTEGVRADTDAVHTAQGEAAEADSDYNLYYACTSNIPDEAHSILNQDPQFVSVPENLHLKAASPARKSGALPAEQMPKYIWDESTQTIRKSEEERIFIEFRDKDGYVRAHPCSMGIYESEQR